jgi:hypothetical protein
MDSEVSVDGRVRIADHVSFTLVQGEAVIVDLKRGLYFGLDEIGTAIWQCIAQHGTVSQAVAQLEQDYDIDPAQLRDDVRRWIARTRAAGLIEAS